MKKSHVYVVSNEQVTKEWSQMNLVSNQWSRMNWSQWSAHQLKLSSGLRMAWSLSEVRVIGRSVNQVLLRQCRLTTRPRLLYTRTEPGSSGHIEWSPICPWLKLNSFVIHVCNGWRRALGQITVKTDAWPGQMPCSGPTSNVSSGMPEHDCWEEARLPRNGTLVCLLLSTQK